MKHGKKLLLAALLFLLMLSFAACGQTEDSPDAESDGQREQIKVSEEQTENKLPEETAKSPNADDPTEEVLPPAEESGGEVFTLPVAKEEKQPEPAEQPENEEAAPHCTISIRCDTILSHLGQLDTGKAGIVPESGVLMCPRTVEFTQGESVFDVLLRETRASKLHMEYTDTPAYGSAYIEGIGNLYEFDCGDLSGWMYRVNGWFPNYGCSQYSVSDGDVIEWLYTCDLGADLGAGQTAGK